MWMHPRCAVDIERGWPSRGLRCRSGSGCTWLGCIAFLQVKGWSCVWLTHQGCNLSISSWTGRRGSRTDDCWRDKHRKSKILRLDVIDGHAGRQRIRGTCGRGWPPEPPHAFAEDPGRRDLYRPITSSARSSTPTSRITSRSISTKRRLPANRHLPYHHSFGALEATAAYTTTTTFHSRLRRLILCEDYRLDLRRSHAWQTEEPSVV